MDTRKLVETYHLAWTSGDFTTACNGLADDLDFKGSMDTFTKADDFIAALSQFRKMVKEVSLLQQLYDETGMMKPGRRCCMIAITSLRQA